MTLVILELSSQPRDTELGLSHVPDEEAEVPGYPFERWGRSKAESAQLCGLHP